MTGQMAEMLNKQIMRGLVKKAGCLLRDIIAIAYLDRH
jgi:hypothetical protein